MPDTDNAIRNLGRSRLRDDPAALAEFNAAVTEEFRAHGGRVGGPFEGADILLLTTVGARSGRPRSTPVEYFDLDGRLLVIGSYGGAPRDPAWVHNLCAHPRAHIEVGTGSRDVLARELTGDERDALFAVVRERAPRFARYQAETSRRLPVVELRAADLVDAQCVRRGERAVEDPSND